MLDLMVGNNALSYYERLMKGPSGRSRPTLSAIGTKLYLMGGQLADSTSVNELWVYDTVGKAWTQKASLPGTGRRAHAAVVIDGLLYISGGFDNTAGSLGDLWRYDPSTDAWTQLASRTPLQSSHIGFAALRNTENCLHLLFTDGTVQLFTPSTNTWSVLSSSFRALANSAVALVAGVPYNYGGQVSGTLVGTLQKITLGTPPTEAPVSPLTTTPGLKLYHTLDVYNGKLYLRSGQQSTSAVVFTRDLWEYTIETNTWRRLKDGGPAAYGHGSAIIGTKLYMFGGFDSNNNAAKLNEFWSIDLSRIDQ